MAKRKRTKQRWKRSIVYPLLGLFLSFSAPIGWLFLRLGPMIYLQPDDALPLAIEEFHRHALLYAYMHSGAVFVLTLFGFALGRAEDRMFGHYKGLLSQRRLLSIKNKQLARLSITDRLTGLANYFRFHQVLPPEFKRARRYNLDLCVLMVDIDHFKSINDTHGHLFGDFILHELGQIFASSLRESDYVARTGGEEFSFILTQTKIDDAVHFADRLREIVSAHPFEHEGTKVKVTLSAGVAALSDLKTDASKENSDRLLGIADEALYEAKTWGRNRVVRYRPKLVEVSATA